MIDTIANVTETVAENTVLQFGGSEVMQSIRLWKNVLSLTTFTHVESVVYYTIYIKAITAFPLSESSASPSQIRNAAKTNEEIYLQFQTALLYAVRNGTFIPQLLRTVRRNNRASSELQSVQIQDIAITAVSGNRTFGSSSTSNDDGSNVDKLHPIMMMMVIGGIVGLVALCIACAFVCYTIERKRQLRRMRVYAAELLDESIAEEEQKQRQSKTKLKKQVSFFSKETSGMIQVEESEEGDVVLGGMEDEEGGYYTKNGGRKSGTNQARNRVGMSPPSLSPSNSNKMMNTNAAGGGVNTTSGKGNEQANKRVTSPMIGRRSN